MARGRCAKHYKQWQRHNRAAGDDPGEVTPCCVVGCGRPAEARGLCHGHYLRWRRTGDVQADRPLKRSSRRRCAVDSCRRTVDARGLCRTHYYRLRVHGDVLADVPVREATGEGSITHGYWKVPVPPHLRHLTGGQTQVAEHRLVMAVMLGRPLYPDETVHHRNGDRLDNRPENLELWSRMQPAGQRVDDKVEYALTLVRRYAPHLLRDDAAG